MKKILKIIVIVLVIIVTGVGSYSAWIYLIAPGLGSSTPELTQEQINSSLLGSSLQTLSEQTIFDYWLKNNEIYAVALTGEIYKVSLSRQEEKVFSQEIQNLSQLKASADGSKAIISFGYPIKETFAIFDTANKSWQPLPSEIIAVAWNPRDSNQLAVLRENNGQTVVSIYSLNNKKMADVIRLNQQDLQIDWATPDEIYLVERPTNKAPTSIWAVHITKKTIRSLIKEELGLMVKWFNNGQSGLKFSRKQNANILEVINKSNQSEAVLPIISLPGKCAIGDKNIYCGSSLSSNNTSWPDDYLKGKRFLPDSLYQIPKGLENLSLTVYDADIEDVPLDIWHPEIKKDRLIFLNRLDQQLYLLDLSL